MIYSNRQKRLSSLNQGVVDDMMALEAECLKTAKKYGRWWHFGMFRGECQELLRMAKEARNLIDTVGKE